MATCHLVRSATWGPGLASDNEEVTFHTALWLTKGACVAGSCVTFTMLLIIPLLTDTKNCLKKKKSLEFVTMLLLFYVLVFWPQGTWDPSSSTRNQTHLSPSTRSIKRRSLNHWATRKVVASVSNGHSSRATAYLVMQARRKIIGRSVIGPCSSRWVRQKGFFPHQTDFWLPYKSGELVEKKNENSGMIAKPT